MNERIEKLVSEAIKAIPDQVDFDLPKEFTEKFAQLIVRECAMIARTTKRETHVDGGAVMIKYFGVEE